MSEIALRSDIAVMPNRLGQCGDDLGIAESAWVSTSVDLPAEHTERDTSEKAVRGLIGYLMKHRHGVPFEEGYLSVTVEAPIFVAREWMRHRIASYSEVSGRYTKLMPVFWVPERERKLINAGSSARPRMEPAPWEDVEMTNRLLAYSYAEAWGCYEAMLSKGIAKEVARACLPVATYTRFRVRLNPRSIMAFLSLRRDHPANTYKTYPMREIEMGAEALETFFALYWPWTHAAFTEHGRVAP